MKKAVLIALIGLLAALSILTGCAGPEITPFKPREVTPEPYTPEPEWNEATDPFLHRLSSLRGTKATLASTAPTVVTLTEGTSTPETPGGATPAPTARTPSSSDPIWGFVYDRIEGGPIGSATVTLYNSRGAVAGTFTTTAQGMYSFVSLSPGYYQVKATASGYTPIPLSTRDVLYSGIPQRVDLDLAYANPFQQIEGGRMDATGPPTATAGYFYVTQTQQTYYAALFDTDLTFAWYTFYIVDPDVYTIDSLKFTFPTIYQRADGSSALWQAGGTPEVHHADLTQITPVSGAYYLNTSKVGGDGTLTIRVRRNDAANELLATYLKLEYDYHHKSRP